MYKPMFPVYHLHTSLKLWGTTTWAGGSSDHEYTVSESTVDQAAYRLQSDDLDRIADYIAFWIFVGDSADHTKLSNVRYEVIKGG